MKIKKLVTIAFCSVLCLSATACGEKTQSSSVSDNSSDSSAEKIVYDVAECDLNDETFFQYPSNTVISTGNNFTVKDADNMTYRAYFPVEKSGELEYRFYFSNTVDSTYDNGIKAYAGEAGGEYTIVSASIYDGGTSVDEEPTNKTAVTFNSKDSKDVAAGETFWSDSVKMNIPQGHYLVWEWKISGENIPCINMSNLTSCTACEDGDDVFKYCDQIPLPVYVGAKRDVKTKICAIGDSITQGCMTDFMEYEYWAAQISQQLGSEYSMYNAGLGYSRASDCSQCGNWLARAKESDVVIVAFGTNDIVSGEYNGDGGNTAQEIDGYLRTILGVLKNAGCRVIVFNAPPQSYKADLESVRTEYNQLCKKTAEEYGCEFFDFASYLCDEATPDIAKYGGHPTGEAGKLVADGFIKEFGESLK